jgi:hypothetical protein
MPKICLECLTRASFNFAKETSTLYCSTHKKVNMIYVKHKKRQAINCLVYMLHKKQK